MKLAPYPKYKPSGVEWLGDVPAHWEIQSSRTGFSIQLGKMLQSQAELQQDSEVPYFKAQHVQWERISTTNLPVMYATPSDEIKYGVVDNDLLVCEGGEVGRAGIVRNPPPRSIVQNAVHRVRPIGSNEIRFLMYLLEHASSQKYFDILCNRSTIAHFTSEKFGSLRIAFPTIPEQQSIVSFLDRQTAKIDTLIDKKQTLIERLQEKRAALITRTVTRGLPPDAARAAGLEPEPKMRASGVEWLGDVPEHWGVLPLRRWYRVVNGGTPSSTEETYWHGSINWITPEDLGRNRSKRIGNSQRTLSIEGLMNCGAQLVPVNSITLSTRAPVGHLAITSRESCTNQGCRTLVPKGSCAYPDYLYYVLLAFRPLLEAAGKGTTFMELSANLLGSHIAPFPPDSEQRAIADFLDRETTKIDGLVAKVETAIARLREYRAALITAAVTGQVDVREAVVVDAIAASKHNRKV